MMILEMKVPSPGESILEVEIAEWLVEDGEYVEKDQAIAEIDSDKATLELPAEESGKIKILVENGETVSVGDIVCKIDTSVIGEAKKTNVSNVNLTQNNIKDDTILKKNKITPLASAIINSHDNILVNNINASAKDGKIRKSDVIDIITEKSNNDTSRKKMSTLRRKIAQRLVAVKNETAMLTTFNEVDMNNIFNIRSEFKEKFKDKYNVNLGFMSFFTKAVTLSLSEFQDVNAMIDGNEIIYHNYCDIGIAVSAEKGLMVPVLRNAGKMTFDKIENSIKDLAIKARDGKLKIDEMTGGTFTITNGGVFGSMLSTPIINPPQSAILGMHNIIERPVVVDGKITIRPMMYVALSYDHRIIDGRESVGFLCKVKEYLENPVEFLFEGNVQKTLNL
ncbi:MAG: dihydrolipoyllysine-residue succinyltransferase [Flavobacteriales bacterium]|nr:dihydrolipoyllysine-residue succinyltransferase [Flavobacteriales bacterium]